MHFIKRVIKKGAPISAIIIPTGISEGEMIILPKRSPRSTVILPIKALTGKSLSVLVPTMHLEIWGTISPTNPISPAKLTTAPAKAEAQTIHIILKLRTFTPREVA